MSDSEQRLVQSWQSGQVNRSLPGSGEMARLVPVLGALGVLLLAMVAEALESRSAPLAVTALAFGFLAVAHFGSGSRAPDWRRLWPLFPLIAFFLVGVLFRVPHEGLAGLSALSSVGGLAAFAIALHLTIRDRATYHRVLLDAWVLGIGFVVVACLARVFSQVTPETGAFSLGFVLQVLGQQADLAAIAILLLALGIGMIIGALEEGSSLAAFYGLALVPLSLPLLATPTTAMAAAGFFAVGTGFLIRRHLKQLGRRHGNAIFIGAVATGLSLASAYVASRGAPSPSPSQNPTGLWHLVQAHPWFGQAAPGVRSPAEPQRFLLNYGYLGTVLLGMTLVAYGFNSLRRGTTLPRPVLAWWSLAGCAGVAWLGFWSAPFEYPVVGVMCTLVWATAMGSGSLSARTRQRVTPRDPSAAMGRVTAQCYRARRLPSAPVVASPVESPFDLNPERSRKPNPQAASVLPPPRRRRAF